MDNSLPHSFHVLGLPRIVVEYAAIPGGRLR